MKKIKDIFIEGPINPIFVAESITKHTVKTTIGGHSIFLGQIREDMIDKKKVQKMIDISLVERKETAEHTMIMIRMILEGARHLDEARIR